jgi:hypothetical protein
MAEAARGEVMPESQWFTLTSFARAMAVGILRDGSPVIASGGDDNGTVRVWRRPTAPVRPSAGPA